MEIDRFSFPDKRVVCGNQDVRFYIAQKMVIKRLGSQSCLKLTVASAVKMQNTDIGLARIHVFNHFIRRTFTEPVDK